MKAAQFFCTLPAMILLAIVSFHVTQAAAPEYLTLWWIGMLLTVVGSFVGVMVSDS
jgi:hypothetical protein